MDELFTVEFNTHSPKAIEQETSPIEKLQPKVDLGPTPYQHLKSLEEAIQAESRFPERLTLHLQDLQNALDLDDLSKALSTIDLMEELFDLELSD